MTGLRILFTILICFFLQINFLFSQVKVDDAVDFTIPDTEGNFYNLFEQFENNKTVVLYFFSTTCAPCYYDATILDSVYNHYSGLHHEVEVWGIASPYSSLESVIQFVDSTEISFKCLTTAKYENVFEYYNVNYTPQVHVTCHYKASGNIGQDYLQNYIEGCFADNNNINYHKSEEIIKVYQNNQFLKIRNLSDVSININIYKLSGSSVLQKTIPPNVSRDIYLKRNIYLLRVYELKNNGRHKSKKILIR